ncbi:hypothetical protein T4A_7720 [Trichinella pseudospiralis]|uniref:Uncharacterized protein n=1 Tax=Trichinella pseudospiralis TaxID=6337 RepID=A0A0V1KBQ2_TRIPS|nr:hypothetical protein T4A_7720 [Trichinella pseudospiralis]KRZ44650.1 hypothetical protein T4C_6791 [Trichinella pseudospiralis]
MQKVQKNKIWNSVEILLLYGANCISRNYEFQIKKQSCDAARSCDAVCNNFQQSNKIKLYL